MTTEQSLVIDLMVIQTSRDILLGLLLGPKPHNTPPQKRPNSETHGRVFKLPGNKLPGNKSNVQNIIRTHSVGIHILSRQSLGF